MQMNDTKSKEHIPFDKHNTWHQALEKSNDYIDYHTSLNTSDPFWISYFRTLIKSEILQRDVLPYLDSTLPLDQLASRIPIQNVLLTEDDQLIVDSILAGHVAIRQQKQDRQCLLVSIPETAFRPVGPPLKESSILGPQVGFIEELDTNVNLIRKRLPIQELVVKELNIGAYTKTKVAVLYMEGVANGELVNDILERLSIIEYNQILDSSYITAMIDDNSNSLFPQSIVTERFDRVVGALTEGKISIVVDGSPDVIILPITLLESFNSIEDYSYPWMVSSFFRLLRFFSFFFSILLSPLYVAVLTYHYELIPSGLFASLASSRYMVPFSPFVEALILELLIESIREAGVHLPLKVAQTLGIIGAIVIGQAVVEANLTSNILLILVSLGTIANFVTPIYKTGNSIRLIKFPLIFLAQLLGLLGVAAGFFFTVIHVVRLSSVGSPYSGLYPFRKSNIQDMWIRLPFSKQKKIADLTKSEKKKKTTRYVSQHKRTTDFDE
ncbi:spore germination protein [Sutcliffiella horikoshii]|uniref:Spore germination protein n=1 Tax=Sutcliffiella horikoshii TaxID=79883 RepID=A0A5D4SWY2_9BACI|nr:spore germination protein [Sutcliffiella horikoshii]TYS67181.1 spore germination protein [Sutcliffiella horikoshii]